MTTTRHARGGQAALAAPASLVALLLFVAFVGMLPVLVMALLIGGGSLIQLAFLCAAVATIAAVTPAALAACVARLRSS